MSRRLAAVCQWMMRAAEIRNPESEENQSENSGRSKTHIKKKIYRYRVLAIEQVHRVIGWCLQLKGIAPTQLEEKSQTGLAFPSSLRRSSQAWDPERQRQR
jgi:hypothetical protein